MEAMTATETMSIYVGTYHKYNCGSIAGKWLDLSDYDSKDEFYEACKELHSDESDPEFMFQDYENIPESWVNESWISEKVWDFLELEDYIKEQVLIYQSVTGHGIDDCLENYENMTYFDITDAYDEMVSRYPQIKEIEEMNLDFVTISEREFTDGYSKVEVNGTTYCVETW